MFKKPLSNPISTSTFCPNKMVTHKNLLHELLQQDQEPFHLNNYISSHLSNLNATSIKPMRPKLIIQTRNFCINHVCFYSFNDSPDVRKSPFIDIQSPFSKTPSKTKAMLLDAAMRIQKHKKQTYKPKPESPISSFGLFRSILKKLKGRKTRIKRQQKMNDNETSCTTFDDLNNEIKFCWENDEFTCPLSPFRFSLEKSPDSCTRTPDFISPATSPAHHHLQQDHEADESIEVHLHEEDKEQCSPVSVLDPPFPDDKEGYDFGAEDDNGYNTLEWIYSNVQRAKHKLLQKLHRFEKLAKLDPIELEKHMSEQCGDDIEEEATNGVDLSDILNVLKVKEIPIHMKRLISDLIVEETKNDTQRNVIVQRVLSRMESWKMVESNTIDMMVELDFRKERSHGWKSYDEHKIREIGMDIEMTIFGVLMEELIQAPVIS